MSDIIQKIIDNPSAYKGIIKNASYQELIIVYKSYQSYYTNENLDEMVRCYENEEGLRNKLLGCSKAVIATLSKYKEKL